jgi:hypothetical protein
MASCQVTSRLLCLQCSFDKPPIQGVHPKPEHTSRRIQWLRFLGYVVAVSMAIAFISSIAHSIQYVRAQEYTLQNDPVASIMRIGVKDKTNV